MLPEYSEKSKVTVIKGFADSLFPCPNFHRLAFAFLFLATLKYLSRGHKFHITLGMFFSSETFNYCSSSISCSSLQCPLNSMASVFPFTITECTECICLACREYSVWDTVESHACGSQE